MLLKGLKRFCIVNRCKLFSSQINNPKSVPQGNSGQDELSLKLVAAKSSDEVLEIFENYLNKEKTLTKHQICSFFYILNYRNDSLINKKNVAVFFDMLYPHVCELIEEFNDSFVASLSNSISRFNLSIPLPTKVEIAKGVMNALSKKKFKSLTNLIYHLPKIFNGPNSEDFGMLQYLLLKILTDIENSIIESTSTMNLSDILNILIALIYTQLQSKINVPVFIKVIESLLHEANEESIDKIYFVLAELNYFEQNLIDKLHETLENYIQSLSIDELTSILLSYSKIGLEDLLKFEFILQHCLHKISEVNITNYINLWLALARAQHSSDLVDKTIENLISIGLINKGEWEFKDLEPYELVNIIISISSLKIKNQPFLENILNLLQKRLKELTVSELTYLAQSTLDYDNISHDFINKFYSEYQSRISQLSSEEIESIDKFVVKNRHIIEKKQFSKQTLKQSYRKQILITVNTNRSSKNIFLFLKHKIDMSYIFYKKK